MKNYTWWGSEKEELSWHIHISMVVYIVLILSFHVFFMAWYCGPWVPWYTSPTDTSKEWSTFIDATFPSSTSLWPVLQRPFCTWWPLLSMFTHISASCRLVWILEWSRLTPSDGCNYLWLFPSCEFLSVYELWLQQKLFLSCLCKE